MELSVIIPAYNEEKRLPRTLEKVFKHLQENFSGSYEVLVANDGSSDQIADSIEQARENYPGLRLLDYQINRGRGAVCKDAAREALGSFILIIDSDCSTDEKFITPFYNYLVNHSEVDILTGSRDVAGARILTPQPFFRIFLNKVFLLMAKILFGWPMHDRVNGFKMFRREAALDIYPHQTETSFFAEAELIYIAERRGWEVRELPIDWTDDRDSKVRPVREAWRSFWGMFKIFIRGKQGFYNK